MLKDEIKLLAQLAVEYLSDVHRKNVPSLEHRNEQEIRISTECHRIKKSWTDLLFSQVKDHVIQRFTGFQQQIILELADSLYQEIENHKKATVKGTHDALILPTFLLERLLDLKDFQIQYFNTYVNEEGKIPDAAIPMVRKKMADIAEKLSAGLQTIQLDVKLKACVCDYLDGILALEANFPISYGSAGYFISFIEALAVTIDFKDNRDLTHSVTEVLFYLNFNHSSFCQWYQDTLEAKKILLRSQDQLSMLTKQLLILKSMPVMLTIGFDPKISPVNKQLENWLNEYIRRETLQFELPEDEQLNKLELKLTVAQLALLVRLLYEEGIFALKNIAALLRFFSGHFTSKKQEHISYSSMNKLYYSGDQFTGYAVRELLLKMVSKINKMFFPT